MKPVFREEMDYLGIDPKYENLLWVESRCYYGFDKNFNKIKFGRKIEKLPGNTLNLISHKKYCDWFYNNETKQKVESEKEKLKNYLSQVDYEELIISISGGKDSTVMEHMIKNICSESGVKYRHVFGNTSNETHHTYKYVKDTYKNLEICSPKEGLYDYMRRISFVPTRMGRACCTIYKEGNLTEYLESNLTKKTLHLIGMRRDESTTRSTYEQIRKGKWQNSEAQKNWNMYLPIIDFTDSDVWSYLIHHEIEFNKLYRFGYGRVGCTNCPFRTSYELKLNEHFLPTYDKHWKEIIKDIFIKNGAWVILNCTLEEFLNGAWRAGQVRDTPTPEVIADFAKYRECSYEVAERYFISNRCSCGKRLNKDMIALNMKRLGRSNPTRMCLKCLAEFLDEDKKELKAQIEEFKDQGCNLF